MSEKIQRTAEIMRNTMHHRYDDGLHHKHNKYRLPYRLHWRSHPSNTEQLRDGFDQSQALNELEPSFREKNLKKTRLRIVKHRIH